MLQNADVIGLETQNRPIYIDNIYITSLILTSGH